MDTAIQRYNRIAQAKHRGSKRSHVTELEDALLILAWEAELLSEGQVSHLLDENRVTLRLRREAMLDRATKLAEAMYQANPSRVRRRGQRSRFPNEKN